MQDGMELDDKIAIVTKRLDEIYRECASAKVILAGDLNVRANEKMKIGKGNLTKLGRYWNNTIFSLDLT